MVSILWSWCRKSTKPQCIFVEMSLKLIVIVVIYFQVNLKNELLVEVIKCIL